MATKDTKIVIRHAATSDEVEVKKLAALDGDSQAPSGSVLVAEAGGRIRAAYGIDDHSHVADPFWYSAELVELMRFHAAALDRPVQMRRRRFGRIGVPALAGGR